jgi:hypothetical protein
LGVLKYVAYVMVGFLVEWRLTTYFLKIQTFV